MSRRKLKPHPAECYVYSCVTCGTPSVAAIERHLRVSCPVCPPYAGDVRGVLYIPKPVQPRRKAR